MKKFSDSYIQSLIKHNTFTVKNTKFINTTLHKLHLNGTLVALPGNEEIVELFSADMVMEEIGEIIDKPVVIASYELRYPEYKNIILDTLEKEKIFALGSIITVETFKHPRILKIDNKAGVFVAHSSFVY